MKPILIELNFLDLEEFNKNVRVAYRNIADPTDIVPWSSASILSLPISGTITDEIISDIALRAYQDIATRSQLEEIKNNPISVDNLPSEPIVIDIEKKLKELDDTRKALELSQEQMLATDLAERELAKNTVLKFNADKAKYFSSVAKIKEQFPVIPRHYIQPFLDSNYPGLTLVPAYKNSGIIGLGIHSSSSELPLQSTEIIHTIGKCINDIYNAGIPMITEILVSQKDFILKLTKDNTDGIVTPYVEGPELITCYSKWTFEYAKRQKQYTVSLDRRVMDSKGFMFRGKLIDSDPESIRDINSITSDVALSGTVPEGLAWKAADNTFIPIESVDDWKEFVKAMSTQGLINFQTSQMRKAAVPVATTLAALKAIDNINYS